MRAFIVLAFVTVMFLSVTAILAGSVVSTATCAGIALVLLPALI